MRTSFSIAQLNDPEIADANEILRSCVHCGFCTATCPTYALLGDELDSPRGRIYLIKDMLEHDRAASETDVQHIDRCLSCLSCMTTCPSGVNYMHLVDHARRHIENTYRRKFLDRILRFFLGRVLPNSRLFNIAQFVGMFVRPVARILPGKLRVMVNLAKTRNIPNKVVTPIKKSSDGDIKFHVTLLTGCVQDGIDPAINQATVRLLTRLGCDVEIRQDVGCCGSLNHHLGQEGRALDLMKSNVTAWSRSDQEKKLDAIVVNASGCGTTLKDYGFILRNDPAYAEDAERISNLSCDITEFLSRTGFSSHLSKTKELRVAYQSPCSMQHGQKINQQPLALLRECGFDVVEPADSHLCCGSAGTFNVLQNELADKLRDKKIASLSALSPDIIASGNIGCMTQLDTAGKQDMPCPIVHTVELIDWATGGPMPSVLQGNESKFQ